MNNKILKVFRKDAPGSTRWDIVFAESMGCMKHHRRYRLLRIIHGPDIETFWDVVGTYEMNPNNRFNSYRDFERVYVKNLPLHVVKIMYEAIEEKEAIVKEKTKKT